MIATLLSAAATCVISLSLGQAALRLAGAKEWSWLAPPVGISVAMLIAAPAMAVPGRSTTMAVLLGVLTVAAILWCGRSPAHRPPLSGLLAALPVAALVLIPFLAVGRAGIIGASLNNDMASHMWIVEGFLSQRVVDVTALPSDYPYGPHAMVAAIVEMLGVGVDHAFAGWTMALPLLNAWTALALVRRASWLGKALTATVVAMPFLVAAYYGQGAFKEVLQAGLVLSSLLLLAGYGPRLGRGRWVPLALVMGGIVSVYSVAGLPWPLAFAGLLLVVAAVTQVSRHGRGSLLPAARRELPAIAIGAAVFVVSLLPQLARIWRFVTLGNSADIAKDNLGNLAGPLPGWEAFGVWNNPDFRLPASPAFSAGMWTAFVLALVVFGAYWAGRRGRWMLPLAAVGAMLIWWVTTRSQSPYVAAKALVIAAPLLLLLAVVPLVERGPRRLLPWRLAALLGLVLFARIGVSDVRALRASPVGPTDHAVELRDLRPYLDGQPTLFLGNDDFVPWEFAGVPYYEPALSGIPELQSRVRKDWSEGMALDFDSLSAATLNSYDWIITTRDAAGSAPPPQIRLARATPSFLLWHRVGRVRPRSILAEGGWPGAVLDCGTLAGRRVLRGGGVAAIRPMPVVSSPLGLAPGGTASVQLPLGRGRWALEAAYGSRLPIDVSAPGLRAQLPASLDRLGPRWPIGRITVRDSRPTEVSIHLEDALLTPQSSIASVTAVVATRTGADRLVPVAQACGRYVDWYRGAVAVRPRDHRSQ